MEHLEYSDQSIRAFVHNSLWRLQVCGRNEFMMEIDSFILVCGIDPEESLREEYIDILCRCV